MSYLENIHIVEETVQNKDVWKKNFAEVRDDGIYVPSVEFTPQNMESNYKLLISKEMFIDAYNKYINNTSSEKKESASTVYTNLPSKDEYFKEKAESHSYWGGARPRYSQPLFRCPKCGGYVRKDNSIAMLSDPPQYRYHCDDCDYATTGL